jgi:hypothetical protein
MSDYRIALKNIPFNIERIIASDLVYAGCAKDMLEKPMGKGTYIEIKRCESII